MARSKASGGWMSEHVNDPYVRRARAQGYRSRAAFKLLELDAKERLLGPGQTVVDLGAAPGSWSQVAAAKVGATGRVIAVDLLEIVPLERVEVVRGDFAEAATLAAVERLLGAGGVDLVLADMAPNISGVAATDQARAVHLAELAMAFALEHLKPGGALVVKVFQGAGFPELLAEMRRSFATVASRKPGASRGRSSEMYLVGRRPKARKAT
ncbi:MAG: RlmE family RNA methyltransferase [Burkholderiales bacterium]|nr:RlmE family RNA methyltransferase [Burkholderiales bacterium]